MTAPVHGWAHRALVAAAHRRVTGAHLHPPEQAAWDSLARAASRHGALGWLGRELRARPEVPAGFQINLQAAAARAAGSHARRVQDAVSALEILAAEGIDGLVLKGPALVERYYTDATLRTYGDVDLYVRPARFEAALTALVAAGFKLVDRNWHFLVGDLRGQVHLVSPAGGTLELHWHVVNGTRLRRTLAMDADELWDASVPWELGGMPVRVLTPGEEIAHLCLHAAVHGCNRLIWLLDIAVLADAADVDWDAAATRLRRWRFGTGGGMVLALARSLAGAGVPEDVVAALLRGTAMRRLFTAAARSWDLSRDEGGAPVRELLVATGGDGIRTRLGLAVDVIVPAPGQEPGRPLPGWAEGFGRVTAGTAQRVRTKLSGGNRARPSEYRATADPDAGLDDYLEAVSRQAGATHRSEIVILSPSSSIGMSHYARAVAEAMGAWTPTTLLDAAGRRRGWLSLWPRVRAAHRSRSLVLVTSPHWATPLLLLGRGLRGGFVFHDPILDAAAPATRPLHTAYYRLMARLLPIVILHGSMFRRHTIALGLRARRVAVVPHGFVPHDLELDEPYDPRGPYVFVGKLHAYKGLHVLIAALEALARGGERVPVVIGGHGITPAHVPAGLDQVTVRPGELGDDEFRALIAGCRAVVLPYERANQSGVLATAFRAGRPVIASRVGSFAEYVEDGVSGLLVPPGDPAALAEAIARLEHDPDLGRSLAAGAAEAWRRDLSAQACARAILEALEPGWELDQPDRDRPPTPRSDERSATLSGGGGGAWAPAASSRSAGRARGTGRARSSSGHSE